jgi:hypothetical protein
MSDADAKPQRSWQEIAYDAAHESNPQRLLELSRELAQALDERRNALKLTNKPFKPDIKRKTG